MKQQAALNWLVPLIGVLALFASGAGLFLGGGMDHPFTTLHGQVVEIYGRGIYQNDTIFLPPPSKVRMRLYLRRPALLASRSCFTSAARCKVGPCWPAL
jgi:hypothetical protein